MTDLNPYASPSYVAADGQTGPEPQLGNVVANTVRVLLAQWSTILVALILVSFSWELLLSYVAKHWLSEADGWQKFLLSTLGQFTVLLLAQGLVMTAATLHLLGREAGLATVATHTLASFPALFLSGAVSFVVIFIGCLLLVIPGIYLSIRWMYYGPAAVTEELSGLAPLRRSWELTNSRLLFSLAVFSLYCIPMTFIALVLEVLLRVSPHAAILAPDRRRRHRRRFRHFGSLYRVHLRVSRTASRTDHTI
jgi:hypothetical protein